LRPEHAHRVRVQSHGTGLEARGGRAFDQEAHKVLMTEVHAVEVADRQSRAARWREAAHLLAREFAHCCVSAEATGFL
jgi:hypothetical protein